MKRGSETWDKVQAHHQQSIRGGKAHTGSGLVSQQEVEGEAASGADDYTADALADLFAAASNDAAAPP